MIHSGWIHLALTLTLTFLTSGFASAATYYVPDNFATIQAAIDAAAGGDTIIVRNGTHAGMDLTFTGKSLALRSVNGPSACIIDPQGAGNGWVFRFAGESSESVLDGFTITNGASGGIVCMSNSSLTITNCIITGNGGDLAGFGGGIYCSQSSPTITNCAITGNSVGAWGEGGGIMCWTASPMIANCAISDNSVGYGGNGGGISCTYDSSPAITNCTITGNSADDYGVGGGIFCMNSDPAITHCTISGNSASNGDGGLFCQGMAGWETITNSVVWGNETLEDGNEIWIGTYLHVLNVGGSDIRNRVGFDDVYVDPLSTLNWLDGNFDADPLFVGGGDYHLTADSPCIDVGSDVGVYDDIDGDVRPQGNGYDIGSDEYAGGGPATVTVYLTSIPQGDGTIRELNENSNTGGAFNANYGGLHALRLGDDYGAGARGEMQYKVIVSFDTSIIPDDATIQSATLMLAVSGTMGANPFTTHGTCYVDVATGFFGTEPRIQKADFQAPATAERVAVMAAPPIVGDIISQSSLDGSGLTAIDRAGSTQMRVYFSGDDNDNDADDWIGFYPGEAVDPLLRPMLCVTYQP